MFDDHLAELFCPELENWMEKNNLIGEFISWSKIEVLPDNHPDHEKSLEEHSEDEETSIHIYGNPGDASWTLPNVSIVVTLHSATIVEKSEKFPEHLLNELKQMASSGQVKYQLKEL